MPTQGLPNFPSKRSLAAKVKRYHEIVAAHERGEHAAPTRGCVRCQQSGAR